MSFKKHRSEIENKLQELTWNQRSYDNWIPAGD